MKQTLVRNAIAVVILCAMLVPALGAMQSQDESRARESRPAPPELVVQMYQIQHSDAHELSAVLRELLPIRGSIVVDARTNSLIVNASQEDQTRIGDLVGRLDVEVESEQPSDIVVRVFDVRDLAPFVTLERLVPVIAPGRDERIAFEADRLMVVSGTVETMDRVHDVLTMFREQQKEQANSAEPAPQRQLRIVWLLSGLEGEGAQDVPSDLRDVIAELSALGIDDLSLASQSMIEIREERPFRIETLATLAENKPVVIGVEGHGTRTSAGEMELKLELGVSGTLGEAEIASSIVAPVGHYTVLAVTPLSNRQSVFVIQVRE